LSGIVGKVITCGPCTLKLRVTGKAGPYVVPRLSPPGCVAVTLHVPATPNIWTCAPTIVQTVGVPDKYSTGNVDEAVAPGSKSASLPCLLAIGATVIVWVALILMVVATSVAATYVLPPMTPPACDAVMAQSPGPTIVTVFPVTVQTLGDVEA